MTNTSHTSYSSHLIEKMKAFYKQYYQNDLALNDWEERFKNLRINEEEIIGKRLISALLARGIEFKDKSILILGAGTGAEGFHICSHYTKEVTFLEPNSEAIEILKEKAELFGINEEKIVLGVGESLPFKSNKFDLILCYTVLEHVQNVQKTLREIHRVIKADGAGLILTPNYNYPEEPHYKLKTFPPAYLSLLTKLHLKIINRYTPFFETLNFITPKKISRILNKNKIPFSHEDDLFPPRPTGLYGLFIRVFKLQRNQFLIIRKN